MRRKTIYVIIGLLASIASIIGVVHQVLSKKDEPIEVHQHFDGYTGGPIDKTIRIERD